MNSKSIDDKLQQRVLLARAVPGDRLMLGDATMQAALAGKRALTPNERVALQQSPLTLRRFRQLALERRAATTPSSASPHAAANDVQWSGSGGMLRAASSSAVLDELITDDRYWTLHFLPSGDSWQVVLTLSPNAPFAARLLREQAMLRVVDGGGAIILQGRLDADGECEHAWPFDIAPAPHFHLYGASFAVEPVAP